MPSLSLYCRVCNNYFDRRSGWHHHLIHESHLTPAREKLLNWDASEKGCVLIVFAKLPVGNDGSIIQYFSNRFGTMVTDFVWWAGRETVAFVQFESRNQVDKILVALEGQQFRIGHDQMCVGKSGQDMPELEWKSLLPERVSLGLGLSGPDIYDHSRSSTSSFISPVASAGAGGGGGGGSTYDSPLNYEENYARRRSSSSNSHSSRFPPADGLHRSSGREIKDYFPERVERRSYSSASGTAAAASLIEINSPEDSFDLRHRLRKRIRLAEDDEDDMNYGPGLKSSSSLSFTRGGRETPSRHVHVAAQHHPRANKTRLIDHLNWIRKWIEIPDKDYRLAEKIRHRLQEAIQDFYSHSEHIKLKVVITRHWILKLQFSKNPDLHNVALPILIYKEEKMEGSYHWVPLSFPELLTLQNIWMSRRHDKQYFLSYEVISIKNSRIYFRTHEGSRFNVSIVSKSYNIVPVQTWRLVKYLSSFDPRCYPVLALIYYWSKVNSIHDGPLPDPSEFSDHAHPQDPTGLSWLLILFLHWEGLIPSPSRILRRKHKVELYDQVDIGFYESGNLAESWRNNKNVEGEGIGMMDVEGEEFAGSVFQLLYKFFLFCATKLGEDQHGWVVNARDAELLPVQEFLSSPSSPTGGEGGGGGIQNCKLTSEEFISVKESLVKGELEKVVMLHPFSPKWRIPLAKVVEAFGSMKTTGLRLKDYLEGNGSVKREKLELNEFLGLLKV